MIELKSLSICNIDPVVGLYRVMIEEARAQDLRLEHVESDDRSIRNLLQYSFDIENNLFFIAYLHGSPIGFIDSTRVSEGSRADEWYIKSVFLLPGHRDAPFFDALVYRVEKEARQKGISRIFSNALMDSDEINALWESIGYELDEGKRYKAL